MWAGGEPSPITDVGRRAPLALVRLCGPTESSSPKPFRRRRIPRAPRLLTLLRTVGTVWWYWSPLVEPHEVLEAEHWAHINQLPLNAAPVRLAAATARWACNGPIACRASYVSQLRPPAAPSARRTHPEIRPPERDAPRGQCRHASQCVCNMLCRGAAGAAPRTTLACTAASLVRVARI